MAAAPDETPRFAVRFESPLVSVSDYDCHICRSGPLAEEAHERGSALVLLRRGAFSRHFGARTVTADVNQAVFFTEGASYRVSHPADHGDRGTVIEPSRAALLDIACAIDPRVERNPGAPFPFDVGPLPEEAFTRHRALLHTLEAGRADALEIEERVLALFADVLAASYAAREPKAAPRKRDTRRDHADRAEAAKHFLATRLGERIALEDVARAVHVSPFHLSRIFERHAGMPLHRYLTKLRLRTALERVRDEPRGIAALALELGFSSHGHFTDAFKREFGVAPSKLGGALETSKDLEV